jgi:DNA-binding GntR family transcriptional regulator
MRPADLIAPAAAPLRRHTVPEELAERLANAILEGGLPAGTRLREADLSSRYGVSRGTIREALGLLARDGLAQRDAHRGYGVTLLGRADVDDIVGMRRLVEPEAVRRLAAQRATTPALRATAASMLAARATADWRRYGALDTDFHVELVRAAGSARLAEVLRSQLVLLTLPLLHSDRLESATAASMSHVDEHAALVDLIDRGAREEAVDLIHRHLDASAERLLAAVA